MPMDYIFIRHKYRTSSTWSQEVSNKGELACHGYSFEEYPAAFEMHQFTDEANSLGTGIPFSLYGRLAIDLFTWKKVIFINYQSSN